MSKLYYAAVTYMALGLVAGVFYREYTKIMEVDFDTQLNTLHTHFLALGMLFFLIVLVLERVFTLSAHKQFTAFFWVYNAGLVVTTVLMLIRGLMQANGVEGSAAISGIAGMGHILLTIGLILLFVTLKGRINAVQRAEPAVIPA